MFCISEIKYSSLNSNSRLTILQTKSFNLNVQRGGGKATRTGLTSDSQMTTQDGFAACTYPYAVRPSPVGLPAKFLNLYMLIIDECSIDLNLKTLRYLSYNKLIHHIFLFLTVAHLLAEINDSFKNSDQTTY